MINNVFETYTLYTALDEVSDEFLINDTHGCNNCYLCSAAALLNTSVSSMMRTAKIPSFADQPLSIVDINFLYNNICASHHHSFNGIGPLLPDYRNPRGNFWLQAEAFTRVNEAFGILFERDNGYGHVITGMRGAWNNTITFYDAQSRQRINDPVTYLDGQRVTRLYIFKFINDFVE